MVRKPTFSIDEFFRQLSKPASSIDEFCWQHCMGKTTFYKLLKEGKGPEIMKIGSRTLISNEAAEKWRLSQSHAVSGKKINNRGIYE